MPRGLHGLQVCNDEWFKRMREIKKREAVMMRQRTFWPAWMTARKTEWAMLKGFVIGPVAQ